MDINWLLWLAAIVIAGILIYIVVKFFFQHILRFLLHGCGFLLLIVILLLILHYLKVI